MIPFDENMTFEDLMRINDEREQRKFVPFDIKQVETSLALTQPGPETTTTTTATTTTQETSTARTAEALRPPTPPEPLQPPQAQPQPPVEVTQDVNNNNKHQSGYSLPFYQPPTQPSYQQPAQQSSNYQQPAYSNNNQYQQPQQHQSSYQLPAYNNNNNNQYQHQPSSSYQQPAQHNYGPYGSSMPSAPQYSPVLQQSSYVQPPTQPYYQQQQPPQLNGLLNGSTAYYPGQPPQNQYYQPHVQHQMSAPPQMTTPSMLARSIMVTEQPKPSTITKPMFKTG